MSQEEREVINDFYTQGAFVDKPLPQRPSSRGSSHYTDCQSIRTAASRRSVSRGSIASTISIPVMNDLVSNMLEQESSAPPSPSKINKKHNKEEEEMDVEAGQSRVRPSKRQRTVACARNLFRQIILCLLGFYSAIRIMFTTVGKSGKSKLCRLSRSIKATYKDLPLVRPPLARPRSVHPSRLPTTTLDPDFIISSDRSMEVQRAKASLIGEKDVTIEYSVGLLSYPVDHAEYQKQMWKPILSFNDMATDILFLPDSSTSGQLPSLARQYVQEGYRVIVPDFNSVPRIDKEVSVTRMVTCIGEIVKDVRRRDCDPTIKRACDSGYSSRVVTPAASPVLPEFVLGPAPPPRRQTLDSVSSLSRNDTSFLEQRRASFTYGRGTRVSLIPRPSTYRPVFIVGVGLGGLVGLHYALRSNPFNFGAPPAPNNRFSVSSVVDQLALYMPAKPNVRRASTHRPVGSIGVAPFPEVRGLILLSATVGITPNMLQRKTRQSSESGASFMLHCLILLAGVQSHLGPISALPPASSAINDIKALHESALNVRIPLLMLHGTKVRHLTILRLNTPDAFVRAGSLHVV